MKVIHADDMDETKLTKQEKEKVSILKLANVGQYVEGVGIRDGSFYLIAQDEDDQMYLAYLGKVSPTLEMQEKLLDQEMQTKLRLIRTEVDMMKWQKLSQLKKNG